MKRIDNHESPRFSMTLHNPYDQYEKNSITALAKLEEGSKRRCSQKVIGNSLIGIGALLAVVAILFSTVLPSIIDDTIKSGVVTCNADAGKKEVYLDPYGDCEDCTPYYFSLYMFNVTNAEDHLARGEKLHVQEVGPYVYRKRQIKLNVTFDSNDRVSYKQYTYFTFQSDMSCSGCSDQDQVIGYDVGYLNVISQAGGEYAFLTALAMGTFGKTLNASVIAGLIKENGPQMMRWVNGLNSLDAEAMKTVSSDSAVLMFLGTGPSALQNLTMSGFAYNGVFAKRTIAQWAIGYPSILAGLGLGSNYVNVCQAGGLEAQCASCTGSDCLKIYAQCKKCATGKSVVAMNPVTCGIIEQIYAAKYGAAEAKAFAAGTCGLCSTLGLCAAPLPGAVETSGLDYSASAPAAEALGTYTQRTGCDDSDYMGEYEEYDGVSTAAIWATLDSRRNPTSKEIVAFASYGNCASPTANVTCTKVQGGDGQGIKPGGAGIHGFADEISLQTISLYMDSIKFNISIVNTETTSEYEGITLHRFIAPADLLTSTAENAVIGTGYPVDGVQSLAFTSGFLAYLSYPVFIYGDSSLTTNLQLTMADGVVASQSTLYNADGSVKTEYGDKYLTYIDIEAGTGKTMRARKRLQAAYAVAKSSVNTTLPMTDVLWPTLTSEVIVPAYWGEESATIGDSKIDSYKSIASLLGSMIPVLVVGLVVGVAVGGWGVVKRRRGAQMHRAHASSII